MATPARLAALVAGALALCAVVWLALPQTAPAPEAEPAAETKPIPQPVEQPGTGPRPNILWVVWDTVRSDRMSLYGAPSKTTPKLDAWAKNARVFTHARSSASSTLPAHAAMFTGLNAMQHGTHYSHPRLDDRLDTIAERLAATGYRTFMWSSNPHVSGETNFDQGFHQASHPWDASHRDKALAIVREKVAPDEGTGMRAVVAGEGANDWAIKAAGELAIPALLDFLAQANTHDAGTGAAATNPAPYFAFVNLMEAHRQYVPPRRLRARFLDAQQVARSYAMDNSWPNVWAYTFGLRELPAGDLAVVRGVYDACLAELDEIFSRLLAALDAQGHLDNTVIVLTSDHGEHLGERHMFDHQFTAYEPALRVPLVVHYPARFAPGRSDAPVMNFDLFPTLLALAGAAPPKLSPGQRSLAVSLLAPRTERVRFAEMPVPHRAPIQLVRQHHPDFRPDRFLTSMCALYAGDDKLVWRQGQGAELYDLAHDPDETDDLSAREPARTEALMKALRERIALTRAPLPAAEPVPAIDDAQRQRLRALGYAK